MPEIDSEWRARLRPASFRGVPFHVDAGQRASGRRIAGHEFPKRDLPYSEDMGRIGRRFPVTCYIIGSDYQDIRDELIEALEQEGVGTLVHPTMGEQQVVVGPYTANETRERGGMVTFEIQFVEAGEAPDSSPVDDTQGNVSDAAGGAQDAAGASADARLNAGTANGLDAGTSISSQNLA